MTLGIDVSKLFSEMIMASHTKADPPFPPPPLIRNHTLPISNGELVSGIDHVSRS